MSPLEQVLEALFAAQSAATIKLPYKNHATEPPTRETFKLPLGESDLLEIQTVLRRAANKLCMERGEDLIFDDPYDHPDYEGEIKRRMDRLISQFIADCEELDDADVRLSKLRELKKIVKDMRPDISLKKVEWDRLAQAIRKVNPSLSDDEILTLFK